MRTIEWTDATWNPVTGYTKVSAGCDNCYAHQFAHVRLRDVYARKLPVVDGISKLDPPSLVWAQRTSQAGEPSMEGLQ